MEVSFPAVLQKSVQQSSQALIRNCSLQTLVNDLYEFRDRFFETHPIEKACDKRDMVEERMTQVLDDIAKLYGAYDF